MGSKARNIVAVTLVVAAVGAALAVSVPYTAAYRNARFSRMSLDEQIRTQARYADDPIFLYYLGRKLNRQQRFAEARPFLERAVGIDPDSVAYRDEWARAQLGTGQVSTAFGQLRQFLGTHPHSAEAHLLVAKFYATEQNNEPARRALEEAVKLDPGNAEAWSLLAQVRVKLGNTGGAQEALERALELRPNDASDHLQLATILGTDPQRAGAEYRRALELSPKDAVCHRQYGRFLLDHGQPAEAETQARRALELGPADPLAADLVGRCLVAEGRERDGIPYLEQAARLAPSDPLPVDDLRRACERIGDRGAAAKWQARFVVLRGEADERRALKDATSAHPEDTAAHLRYAAALARIGDVNGCVQQHAFAARTRPDSAPVLIAAARDLDRCDYSKEALPLARQAAEAANQNPEAFETLGDILVHLGRLEEAAVNYDRIRDWKQSQRAVYAQRIAHEAKILANSDAPAEKLLRQASHEQDTAKAEPLLHQALAVDPDNTRCLRALLLAQYHRGEAVNATNTAARLLTISPEDGIAHALFVVLYLRSHSKNTLSEAENRALDAHLGVAGQDTLAAPAALYASGLVELKRGHPQTAVHDLEQAARVDPTSLEVYRKLAEARDRAGDVAGAKRALAELEQRRHSMEE